MKKICFSLDVFLFGGIEKIAINYLNMLSPEEYDIDVFILANYEDMVKQIPSYCNVIYIDLPYYALPESRASTMIKRKGGACLYYLTFLMKKIKEPFYKVKFNKYRQKKYDVAIAFSGHLNDIYFVDSFLNADKKIVWCHGMIYQYLLLSPAFEKRYSNFDHIVSINHLDQSEIFVHKPYLNYDIVQIYNPIPNETCKINSKTVEELHDKYGEFVIMVARFAPPKDPITLIDAFIYLYKNKSDFHKNLVFVGDGEYRNMVENYIIENQMENHIFCVGSKANVMDYYKAAELSVLSSLNEGLPTVLLEAMQMEIPVVATNAQWGVADILGNNEYGRIVPIKDPIKLAESIYEILNDKVLYNHYVKMGKERIKDFDSTAIKKEFERLLDRRSDGIE